MTLLEVMLVLAIGGSILILSLKQYFQWSEQSSAQQLQYNVDSLFQAMAYYYKSNCADSYDGSGMPVASSGALSPTSITYPPTTSVTVTMTALQSDGLLPNWQPLNPLVNASGGTSSPAYVLQFNPMTMNRNVYACWNFGTTVPGRVCTTPQQIPTSASTPYPADVVLWRIQIAVLIQDTTNIEVYKNQLLADCISSTGTNGTVTPCATSTGTGDYLVWERLPSFASPTMANTSSQSIQNLKTFNLQYSHDQMYEFNNVTDASSQWYLCGG